jgi:DNA-binding HxlR family transcriptional regulator
VDEQKIPWRQDVETAMVVFGGRWVVAVLAELAVGPLHFTELLHEINAVDRQFGRRTHERPLSNVVLVRTLERMQEDGLLVRHRDPSPHPSVQYELTAHGQALLAALRPLAKWGQEHRTRLGSGGEPAADASVAADP